MKTIPTLLATLLAATTLLSACGGGGGGGGTPPGSTLYTATCSDGTTQISTLSLADATAACVVATAVYTSSIVATVPADTYNAVTQAEEKAAFALLNAERVRDGFGALEQSALLDVASRGHADWLIYNNYSGHYQNAGTLLFTGVDSNARAQAAGYIPFGTVADDLLIAQGSNNKNGMGAYGVRRLLASPYHSISLLSNQKQIGLSVRNVSDTGATQSPVAITHFNLASTSTTGNQDLGSSDVVVYPCNGATGVAYSLRGEEPSPVPSRNLLVSPVGHPIIVMIRQGRVLTLTSATVTKVSTGASVIMRAPVTSATDVNQGYYGTNAGYVLPDVALEPSTQYQTTVTGKNGAAVFSRTCSFTTGSVNY